MSHKSDGRAIYPPGVQTPMRRYRQPEPEPEGAWHLVRSVLLWTLLAALVVFLAVGSPDSQDVAGTALYLLGALAAITGPVVLVFVWIDRTAGWPPERVRTVAS